MPDRYQESHIRHVPMFSQLSDNQFQLVARAFEVRRYNAGDRILMQGTEVPGLLIVADGQVLQVQVSSQGAVTQHGVIQEGQYIYDNALFGVTYAETHLQTVRPTTILLLSRAAMGNLLSHHGELRSAFGLSNSQDHHLHDVHFKTQRENEQVLLKTRRHWFSMMRWLWLPIVFIIGGLIFATAVPDIAFISVPLVFILGIAGVAYVVVEWLNDSVIVTDQRVIRIIHTILTFHEVRNEVALESIQEANAEIPSFDIFARIFRYGDVELKTAGSKGNYILDFMPNPEQLQDLILEDAREFRASRAIREQQTMRAEVDRWVNEPFRAGQNTPSEQKNKNVAQESKLKDIYTPGEGPLSPFVMSFPTDNGGIVYRKHWFVWMRAIAFPAVWLAGTVISIILLLFTPLSSVGFVGWVLAFVAALIGIVWFYLVDWDWRHDYYLITESNITIVNQRPLWLQNESDQILLKQVDNVVAETKGFFQQIFKYGDVRVALVGADTHKLFDNIANPRDVQSEITSRQQRQKQRVLEEQERVQRETIGEYLSLYHQTRAGENQVAAYPDNQPLPYQPSTPQAQSPVPNNQALPYQPSTPQAQPPVPNNQALPYQPSTPQAQPTAPNPMPSPFGRRPAMSQGRPYTPSPQPPPSRPAQSPYRPAQNVPYQPTNQTSPQQSQHNPVPPMRQQGQYPPQNIIPSQQGQGPPVNPMPPPQSQHNPVPPMPQQGQYPPQNMIPPQQGQSPLVNPTPQQGQYSSQNPPPPPMPPPPNFSDNRDG